MGGGWLNYHLDTFVMPIVGIVEVPTQHHEPYFSPIEMSYIKNAWRAVKREARGSTVILPGRDVFIFEILARRENYPTIFMPQCSRMTVNAIKLPPEQQQLLVLDTGFVGSIPRGLGVWAFKLFSADNKIYQVFPGFLTARSLALKIEKTPKYWESARLGMNGEIIQELSLTHEFIQAALLTIEVYKDSSPRTYRRARCKT